MQRWENAEKLYFSLINKEPFEQLKNKITAYIDAEDKRHLSDMLKTIYYISMAVSDEKTFELLSEYIKEYGVNHKFYDNSFEYYYLYKILLSETQDITIASDYFDTNTFGPPFLFPLSWIAAMENSSALKWEFFSVIVKESCIEPNLKSSIADEYLYYLVSKKRFEKIKEFCDAIGIGMAATLNIAIEYPDIFYGYIKDNFFDKLPKYFKYDNKVRPVEKLIPFLFRSKEFSMDIHPFNTDIFICDIITYLYDVIGMEKIVKISEYIPKITTIELTEIKRALEKNDELIEFIINKMGDHITITCSEFFVHFRDSSCTIKLFDRLPDSNLYINVLLLKHLIKWNDDLLNYLLNRGAETPLSIEEKITLIKELLPLDCEARTQTMIKIGIISPETWNEAVTCAVEHNALKVLNMLNLQYNDIMSGHIN